jgi:hypothetical protein
MPDGTPPARRALESGDEDATPGVRRGYRRPGQFTAADVQRAFALTLGFWVAGAVTVGIVFVVVVRSIGHDVAGAAPVSPRTLGTPRGPATPRGLPTVPKVPTIPLGDSIVAPTTPPLGATPFVVAPSLVPRVPPVPPVLSVPARPRARSIPTQPPAPAASAGERPPKLPEAPSPAASAPARASGVDQTLPPSPDSH